MKAVIPVCCLLVLMLTSSPTFAQTQDAEDSYLAAKDVKNYLSEFKNKNQELWLEYSGSRYALSTVKLVPDYIIAKYEKGVALISFDFDGSDFGNHVIVHEGDFDLSHITRTSFDRSVVKYESANLKMSEQADNTVVSGDLVDKDGHQVKFSMSINDTLITAGTSRLVINDHHEAVLTGLLGTRTYFQFSDLIKNNPDVKTVVIQKVNGSLNDDINVYTGRLLRNSGLNTTIPHDGFAHSGGVDLFVSGNKRLVEEGGVLGVHSWCCSKGKTGDQLSRDDIAHRSQLDYFEEMLGKKNGRDFYFFTLSAAAFDEMHEMSQDELRRFALTSN